MSAESPSRYDLAGIITVLARTPPVLRGLLLDIPDSLARGTEGEDTFSPFDVVGHLIAGETIDWITRLQHILASGEATRFEPFDRFSQFETSRGKTLTELLDEFTTLRAANLETLRGILDEGIDLEETGIHPELGRVTIGELLSTWAVHDLGHIAQVARVMAKQFGPNTGPWGAYLPVLSDRTS